MDVFTPIPACSGQHKPHTAIFLSGSGSNAEQILRRCQAESAAGRDLPFVLRGLVTDAPARSRALELGRAYGLPVIAEDIRAFYQARGETRVSIMTERGRQIRSEWTAALHRQLAPWTLDFGIFAGFVPLTNLAESFPCLNVHPGDLTYEKEGRRLLVGLHVIPIERAILEGLDILRSSVILVQPYTPGAENMDSGPILGISTEVPIDLQGESLEHLQAIQAARPPKRPAGGYADRLEELAAANQERLKEHGDWQVLPAVVWDFAAGLYALDAEGKLGYRLGQRFHPVETIVFSPEGREVQFR